MSAAAVPLAIYVHMPWCVRKCPYCDFNSHVVPNDLPENRYITALLDDLELDVRALGADRSISSIFFGGGTPSLFSGAAVARFLREARQRIPLDIDVEITLEANPGTLEHGRFAEYRDAGVNRISLGAQSFNDQHLQVLGRIHGSTDIERAVAELVAAGIDNFNLDLMYGLPHQTTEQALADVQRALALGPTHLSQYQLTLEPGTVFYHRPPSLPDTELTWEMQVESQALLDASGYEQYEISAYASAGRRCRHNLNYWRFGDYLGLGAGAHGKISAAQGIRRTTRCKQPREYLSTPVEARASTQFIENADDLVFEFMLNVLRLSDGFDLDLFESRTRLPRSSIEAKLHEAQARGLLTRETADRWSPTALGARFLNDLQAYFLPEPARALDK